MYVVSNSRRKSLRPKPLRVFANAAAAAAKQAVYPPTTTNRRLGKAPAHAKEMEIRQQQRPAEDQALGDVRHVMTPPLPPLQAHLGGAGTAEVPTPWLGYFSTTGTASFFFYHSLQLRQKTQRVGQHGQHAGERVSVHPQVNGITTSAVYRSEPLLKPSGPYQALTHRKRK